MFPEDDDDAPEVAAAPAARAPAAAQDISFDDLIPAAGGNVITRQSASPSSTTSQDVSFDDLIPQSDYARGRAGAGAIDSTGAVGQGLIHGGTLGFDDEIAGAANAGWQGLKNLTPWGNGKSMGENYTSTRDYVRGLDDGVFDNHPIASGSGQVGAGLALGGGISALPRAATMSSRMIAGAATGALEGGANGAGNSSNLGNMLPDAAKGAGLGAVAGGLAPGVGAAASWAGGKTAAGLGTVALGGLGAGLAGATGVALAPQTMMTGAAVGAGALAGKYGGRALNWADQQAPGALSGMAGEMAGKTATVGDSYTPGATGNMSRYNPNNPQYRQGQQHSALSTSPVGTVVDPETTGSIHGAGDGSVATGPTYDSNEVLRRLKGTPYEQVLADATNRGSDALNATAYILSASDPGFRKLMGWTH